MLKKVFIILFVGLVAGALFLSNSYPVRVAYHKWRLAAAMDNAKTAGAGKPTGAQELVSLLTATPPDNQDYTDAWLRHEDALVDLHYLARREFVFSKRLPVDYRYRLSEAAEKAFCGQCFWSLARSPSNVNAIVITAPPDDMRVWEEILNRFNAQMAGRRFSYLGSPQAL
jgi:hypothetical protein